MGDVDDSVDMAKEYISKLEDLLESVTAGERQVKWSAEQALQEVNKSMDELTAAFATAVKRRRTSLCAEVERLRDEGLAPLTACHKLITEQMQAAQSFAKEGDNLTKRVSNYAGNGETVRAFIERGATFLGRLPAVPSLEEIPDVQFECPLQQLELELTSIVEGAGRVSRLGPVQICALEEKPGALLVHWQEVETERPTDVCWFRLQRAYGDIRGQRNLVGNFHDEYMGAECQRLVRNLRPLEAVTLRVCCRAEGDDAPWSAWSLPRAAATSIPPFSWEESNPNYIITNEKKIAAKCNTEPSILFSSDAQFGPDHSIEFTVLESGIGCSDEGIALVDQRIVGENLMQPGALFLNAQGNVFIDGAEKTTKLPSLEKGSKVCFTCEHVHDSKIRVHIDNNNKTVTYDWRVSSTKHKLFFAICFGQEGWKVLVE